MSWLRVRRPQHARRLGAHLRAEAEDRDAVQRVRLVHGQKLLADLDLRKQHKGFASCFGLQQLGAVNA